MRLFLFSFWLAAAISWLPAGFAQAPQAQPTGGMRGGTLQRSYADWKAACARLPSNRALHGRFPQNDLLPLPQFSELASVIDAYFQQCKTGPLSRATNWVGTAPGDEGFFSTSTAYFARPKDGTAPIPFEPYAEKLSVPDDSEIFFRADLHGDLRTLLADLDWLNAKGYLRGFEIARPHFHMIFLGDYTDRGAYGIEVLYTLLRLKLANPDQVFMARGNHEEISLQSRYGFLEEARAKYGASFNEQKVERLYDFLPVVIYAGTSSDFVQCNHGGAEPGYNPRALLESPANLSFQFLGTLNQKQFLGKNPDWLGGANMRSRQTADWAFRDFKPDDPISPTVLGFMWNDFAVFASEPRLAYDPRRAFVYGAASTKYLLESCSAPAKRLQAVFRGHQQSSAPNPMMRRLVASRGVFRHWQESDSETLSEAPAEQLAKILEHDQTRSVPSGSVWTFNIGPDTAYGENCGFTFDAFGLLKVASKFSDWRLQVVNVDVEF